MTAPAVTSGAMPYSMSSVLSLLKKRQAAPNAAQQFAGQIPVEQALSQQSQAQANQSRTGFMDTLSGGQDALNQSIESAMSAAMPEFRKAMQGVQETEVARGVGLGGLGTSYEGDLESAFHRNIANAAGSQALNLYGEQLGGRQALYQGDTENANLGRNRYLDTLASQRDYETAQANAKKKRKSGLFGAIGGALGGIGGFLLGGPAGAQLGASAGSSLGGSLGG